MGYVPIKKPKEWSTAEYRAYLEWALAHNPLERLSCRLHKRPNPLYGTPLADVLAAVRAEEPDA